MDNNYFKNKKINVLSKSETPFTNANDIYQDGIIPFARDKNNNLWAISGHTHIGHIGMFKGTCLDDIKEVYPIKTLFRTGHKDYAFSNIDYPENVSARGSIWPFGLYICPNTNRFFAFFHNETGWAGEKSQYDAYGLCEKPRIDSDFRHIGLMHSDDEGRTWSFDRWIITSEKVCYTNLYKPEDNIGEGQNEKIIDLGAGDFTLFNNPKDDYLYLLYNIIKFDLEERRFASCDLYIARSRKRKDGVMSDFVKYYNGSFSEPGVLGKETPILLNSWHNKMVYNENEKSYLISSTPFNETEKIVCSDYMSIRETKDFFNFSDPICVTVDNKKIGDHYNGIFAFNMVGDPNLIIGNKFTVICCNNGTDVVRYDLEVK